jgi:hypothetical protein
MLATVDSGQLLEVAWVSLVASITVTCAFSLVVLFSGRSAEARRSGSGRAAAFYAGMAAVAMLAFAAVVVFGVHIMLTKA